jgi:hypothetical protein
VPAAAGVLLPQWRERFEVEPLAPGGDPLARLTAVPPDRTACVVMGPAGLEVLLTLKADADLNGIAATEPNAVVRRLDITRIEHLVVREIIASGQATVTLDYSADAARAFGIVGERAAAVAVLGAPVAWSRCSPSPMRAA